MVFKNSYTKPYRKEGEKHKLTLHFTKERIKKIDILMKKNMYSMSSAIEEIVNNKLDRMKS
jgi:hypothetical protein